jgi:hypothetical protein
MRATDTAGLYRRAHDCKQYAREELLESELELNFCRWQRRLQQMEDRLLRCEQCRQPCGPAEAPPAAARDGKSQARHVSSRGEPIGASREAASSEACCALSDVSKVLPVESSLLSSDGIFLAISPDAGLGQAWAGGPPALQEQPLTVSAEPVRAISHAPVEALYARTWRSERARGGISGYVDGHGSDRILPCTKACVPEAFAFQVELEASSAMHAVTPLQSPRRASPLPRKSSTPSDSIEGAPRPASAGNAVGEKRRDRLLGAVSFSCEDVAGRARPATQLAPQPSRLEPATSDCQSDSAAPAPGLGAAGPLMLARQVHPCRPPQRRHMHMVSPEELREIVSSRAELRPCEFSFCGLSPKRPSIAVPADAARPHSILLSDDELHALGEWRAVRGRMVLLAASASGARPSHRSHLPERGPDTSFGSGSVSGLRNRLHELRVGHDGMRRRTLGSRAPRGSEARCWASAAGIL